MTAPRDPKPTVNFIDVYCAYYKDLFPEVRSFESFKALHLVGNAFRSKAQNPS
jgi:hypothetical protein